MIKTYKSPWQHDNWDDFDYTLKRGVAKVRIHAYATMQCCAEEGGGYELLPLAPSGKPACIDGLTIRLHNSHPCCTRLTEALRAYGSGWYLFHYAIWEWDSRRRLLIQCPPNCPVEPHMPDPDRV